MSESRTRLSFQPLMILVAGIVVLEVTGYDTLGWILIGLGAALQLLALILMVIIGYALAATAKQTGLTLRDFKFPPSDPLDSKARKLGSGFVRTPNRKGRR